MVFTKNHPHPRKLSTPEGLKKPAESLKRSELKRNNVLVSWGGNKNVHRKPHAADTPWNFAAQDVSFIN